MKKNENPTKELRRKMMMFVFFLDYVNEKMNLQVTESSEFGK